MAGSGGRIEGFVESLSAQRIAGWAWRAGSDDALVLQVYAGEVLLGETVAERFRTDLAAGGKGNGQHAFEYLFPTPFGDFARRGAVRVTVRGTDRVIPLVDRLAERLGHGAPTPTPAAPGATPAPPAEQPAPQPLPSPPPVPAPVPVPVAAAPPPVAAPRVDPVVAAPALPSPPPGKPEPTPPAADQAAKVQAAPAQPAPPAKPAGVVPRVDGLTLRGGALSGRATLEDHRTVLLVTADGAPLGEAMVGDAEARAADPMLGPRGFRLLVPPGLMDGADHRVALFDAATGQRLEGGSITLRFPLLGPPPPIPPPPAQQADPGTEAPAGGAAARIAIVSAAGDGWTRARWLATLCQLADAEPALIAVGTEVPAPPDDAMTLHQLAAADIAALAAATVALAKVMRCTAVLVSPPSFANLLVGTLLRRLHGCALIVDANPASIQPATPIDAAQFEQDMRQQAAEQQAPSGPAWAALAPALIAEADGIIVANPVLRRRSGGMMVRQGRDEQAFDPARYDRDTLRASFGYTPADRVILLYGSLSLRDGIVEIADALERVADPRLALCVVGSLADPKIEKRFATFQQARIKVHPAEPGPRVPELLAMADCVAVLQQATQADAATRVPPRLIDALAMDVPVLATPAPPLQDLAAAGAVQMVADPTQLDAALRSLAASPPRPRNRARAVYLAEYSQRVNAARLGLALHAAPPPAESDPPAVAAVFRLLQSVAGATLPFLSATPAPAPPMRTRLRPGEPPRDLVFLSSGNDSDLYGSRADMIAAHLLSTGKVRRILHLDARLSAIELEAQAAGSDGDAYRGSLIYAGTVRRVLGLADTPGFTRRTFLHRGGKRAERLMGRDLPPASAYLEFVQHNLRELDSAAPPLLWVSGAVADYAMLRQAIAPALVIADFDEDPLVGPDVAIAPYQPMLADADIVFCSTDALLSRVRTLRPDIVLVANAARGSPLWDGQVTRMWQSIEG